jgi:tRNA A37 threonylcarbamoyladenosine synthetase subunit TsaC/SUA5/YrdC
MRVPDHPVPLGLLEALGQPLLASTLRMPDEDETLADPDDIEERLGKRVDLIIDAGWLSSIPTTIVDLTGPKPLLRRAGLGFDAIAGEVEQAEVS